MRMSLKSLFLSAAVMLMALVSHASASIIFNFVPGNTAGSPGTGDAGTVYDGLFYNEAGLNATDGLLQPAVLDAGGVVDTGNVPVPGVGLNIDTDNNRDVDDGFTAVSDGGANFNGLTTTTYGADIGQTFLWNDRAAGEVLDVQVTGLAAGTYSVEIVASSRRSGDRQTHDYFVQGTEVLSDLPETAAQLAPLMATGIVGGDGLLTIGIGQDAVGANTPTLQAIRITLVPEPSSVALLFGVCAFSSFVAMRRRRR